MIDDEDRAPDPAFAAVDEAGGGVAEGFEQSERELIERIGDPDQIGAHPNRHEIREAAEAEQTVDNAGEADHAHSSAVTDDDR